MKSWMVMLALEVVAPTGEEAERQVAELVFKGSGRIDEIPGLDRARMVGFPIQIAGDGSLASLVAWANDVLHPIPGPDTPPVAPRVMQTGEARDRRKSR